MSATEKLNLALEVSEDDVDPAGSAPAGESSKTGGVEIDSTAKPTEKPKADERPDWLPEGMEDGAALAKAYKELRGKMSKDGAPKDGEKPKGDEKPSASAKADAEKPTDETPADDSALRTAITEAAGGEAGLKATLEWAKANASDAAVNAYNAALKSGDAGLAALAFSALKGEHSEAVGEDPQLLELESTGRTAGVKPFASEIEMVKAMQDPRYDEGDPAYHREVEARLKVSKIW